MLLILLCAASSLDYYVDKMTDEAIDMTNDNILKIYVLYFQTSLVIHNRNGFTADVYDLNDNFLGNIDGENRVVDFAYSTGYVLVNKTGPESDILKFSAIIYSRFKETNECVNTRIVSIGGSHKFTIASALSKYYSERNKTYITSQSFCIWIATPFDLDYSFFPDVEKGYDYMSVYIDSANTDPYPPFEIVTGTNSFFMTRKSTFLYWFSDDTNVFNHMRFFAEMSTPSPDIHDYINDSVEYINNYQFQIPTDSKSKRIYKVKTMTDECIDMLDYDILEIICPSPNTSVVIHNSDFYNATVYDSENVIIGSFSADSSFKVVDFGPGTGYILVKKSSSLLTRICFSAIIMYEFFEDCDSIRVVSSGGYHKYVVAAQNSIYSYEQNLTYESDMNLCFWLASPVETRFDVSCNLKNDDILRFFKYNSAFKSVDVLDLHGIMEVSEKSSNSVVFTLFSQGDGYDKEFLHIKASPFDSSSQLSDISSYNIKYAYLPYSRIPTFDTTSYVVRIFTMCDLALEIANYQSITIICSYPETSVVIHNKNGFMADVYDLNDDKVITVNGSIANSTRLFSFGLNPGKIVIYNVSSDVKTIFISAVVFSQLMYPAKCDDYRVNLHGVSKSYIIASPSSPMYENSNIEYLPNQKICIWLSSPFPEKLSIDYDTELGFDRLYAYSTPSEITLSNIGFSRLTGKGTFLTTIKNSVVLYWETDSDGQYGHINIKSSVSNEQPSRYAAGNVGYYPDNVYIPETSEYIESGTIKADDTLFLTISTMSDFSVNMSQYKLLEIICPFTDTSVIFHNNDGFSATAYNSTGFANCIINGSSDYPGVDFGNDTGIIRVEILSNNVQLQISAVVYSRIWGSRLCQTHRNIRIGTKDGIFQQIVYSSSSPTAFIENSCIWVSSPVKSLHRIQYSFDQNHRLLMFLPPSSASDTSILKHTYAFTNVINDYINVTVSNSALYEWHSFKESASSVFSLYVDKFDQDQDVQGFISYNTNYSYHNLTHRIGDKIDTIYIEESMISYFKDSYGWQPIIIFYVSLSVLYLSIIIIKAKCSKPSPVVDSQMDPSIEK